LNDPQVLARATPGVKTLVPDGEDRFKAELELGLGPVRGVFSGHVEVRDKQEPSDLTLRVDGSGGVGGVRAEGKLRLEEVGQETLVHYQGSALVVGTLAAVGSRLFSGMARKLAAEFFENLRREGSG
jgi:carbon monoxide dehydrogenase subunit G